VNTTCEKVALFSESTPPPAGAAAVALLSVQVAPDAYTRRIEG
jgi:hypothetical protein